MGGALSLCSSELLVNLNLIHFTPALARHARRLFYFGQK